MSTDQTSLIGKFTQRVHQLSVRPLVWLAVLSTTAILACKDDPLGVDGTGNIAILVVPLEQPARADISAPEKPNSEPAKPALPRSVSIPLAGNADTEDSVGRGESAQAAREATAPPRRDLVVITVSGGPGPTEQTSRLTPNPDGSVVATFSNLPVGTYSILILGMDTDLGGELVSEFGQTSGVVVREDETTEATVSFGSFLPDIDPMLQTTTSAFRIEIGFSRVPTATGYVAEVDNNPSFSNPSPISVPPPDTSVILSFGNLGTFYVRVRAENNTVSAGESKPSDPVVLDVVADLGGPTGDDAGTALFLGTVNTATGQYPDFNIYPATDEDWFALDLTTDGTLTVAVLSPSLTQPALVTASAEGTAPPSDLNPFLEIFDPGLTLLASNDDDATVEPRLIDVPITTDGTHYIRVTSSAQSSVGHYELIVTVNAPVVARVEVTPPTATIIPTGQVQLAGRTFDQLDVELFGREAIWSSSDDVIATVDGTGFVTGQSLGTATVTFESEGISGTATIDVTNVPAAKVVITPTGNVIDGIGQTAAFTAEAFDDQDVAIPGKPINWYTTNTYVADVDNTGLAQGVDHGQTVLTAEADGVEGYAVVTVNDVTTIDANFWDMHPQASGTAQILRDVWAERKDAVYVVGQTGTVLFNNGTGWAAQTNPATDAVRAIWGVDEFSLVAVGNGGLIMETGDMGQTWVAESPSPTSLDLWDVWGSSLDNVWAAGGNSTVAGTGVIVHYDGSAWAVEPTGAIDHVAALWGFASDDVWAVGDFGLVLHNDGTGWTVQPAPTGNNFTALWGPRSTDLFAATASGEVFRYNGTSWALQSIPASPGLWGIHGASSGDVYVVGETATLLRFDGVSWTSLGSTATDNLLGVFSTPNGEVIAVGNGGMIQQGTRGATVVVTPGPSVLNALGDQVQLSGEVRDAISNVVASGDIFSWTSSDDLISTVSTTGLVTAVANGTVTITADIAGLSGTADVTVQQLATVVTITPNAAQLTTGTATQSLSATAEDANANPISGAIFNWTSLNGNIATVDASGLVTQVAAGQATISADLDGAFGYALVTSTGDFGIGPVGLWSVDNSNTTANFTGVWGTSRSDIYAVADNGIVMAYDGTDWNQSLSDPTSTWKGVWGLGPSEIYVAGGVGKLGSFDGSTWSVSTIGTVEDLQAVWGTSPADIFAVGLGTIMHFDGNAWSSQTSGTTQQLHTVWGTSSSDVFAVGGGGTILHYDGVSWSAQTSGTTVDLFGLWGTAPNDVFVAGVSGETYHYDGTSWSMMASPNTFGITGLWGTDDTDLYGVGDQGATVYYNGSIWSSVTPVVTENLKNVWGTSNPVVIGVGDGGVIQRGSRGITTSITPTTVNFVSLGSISQLTAEARDQNNAVIVGVPWAWSSSDDAIATVDQNGLVTSVANGPATITASTQGFVLNVPVTVAQVSVGFAVVPNQASIQIGETLQLVGGSLDANNNPIVPQPPITWSTNDASVATVDVGTGLVTANGIGVATISATDGTNNATAAITVTIATSAVPMQAGEQHGCAIDANGTAFCWGDNQRGQLGDGSTSPSDNPVQVSGGVTFQSISGGQDHTCGIAPDGSAYCWGSNDQGQLGDGTNTSSSTPVLVTGGRIFAELDAGSYHTCGLTQFGEAFCWGQNNNGQVGDGSAGNVNSPSVVFGGRTYQSITAGRSHSCAVEVGGDAYCWGYNWRGQLGNGSRTDISIPVQVSAGGTTYKSISAGHDHTCAVTTGGDANCWGNRDQSQLGDGLGCCGESLTPVLVSGTLSFRSISTGAYHTCAVTTSDVGYCWGDGYKGALGQGTMNQEQTPTAISGGLAFASVSAGNQFSCGRTTGGEVYCWGNNSRGQLGNGAGLSLTPQAISGSLVLQSVDGGDRHACALDTGGAAHCWGQGGNGQLGDGLFTDSSQPVTVSGGRTFTSVRAGDYHYCALEASTGDAYCWGRGGSGQIGNASTGSPGSPTLVAGGFDFTWVGAGAEHSCGILVGGDAYCWGRNDEGQLGGTTTASSFTVPVAVQGGHKFSSLSVGGVYVEFTCGITTVGDAYCWGENGNGELGDGTNTTTGPGGAPVAVSGGHKFSSLESGYHHTCGLISGTGAAYCWGRGSDGQLGDGQFGQSNTPVAVSGGLVFASLAAGSWHTCGTTSAGNTYCWGRNSDGELGTGDVSQKNVPTLVQGFSFSTIGAGAEFSCGITSTGVGYCWGRNTDGELGNGRISAFTTPQLVVGGIMFKSPATQ